MSLTDELKTRSIDGIEGLFVVIVQDVDSGEILMQAYADEPAIEKTLETGLAHYYSTSRRKPWLKGESSGHTQKVEEIYVDCDGDALIYRIRKEHPACHMGYHTCFFRKISDGEITAYCEPEYNPKEVY
ncbi:MAG: phosphoribosyl-AMP cyclohydrolase [Candidatus Altiarchaeales archaeon]|nr:phosphoribosyl-AMP cyclohydrolase [Candidatus Altiarchaeales archaeon]